MSIKNLEHKRILLTRAEECLPALDASVQARGAQPFHLPCLGVEAIYETLLEAMSSLHAYSDVVFTSTNGVNVLKEAMDSQGFCIKNMLEGKRIAAVGQATADALRRHGVNVDIIPYISSQDGLLAAYGVHGLPRSLLFFRAEEGRDTLSSVLESKGVQVTMVFTYRTICPQTEAAEVIQCVQKNEIDAVLLGSPKTARYYIRRVGSLVLADQPVVAVISESMAVAVRSLGLSVQVVAKRASFEAMLDALDEYFESHPS